MQSTWRGVLSARGTGPNAWRSALSASVRWAPERGLRVWGKWLRVWGKWLGVWGMGLRVLRMELRELRRELRVWLRELRTGWVCRGTSPPTRTNERVVICGVVDSRLGGEDLCANCWIGEEEWVELVVPRELE